MNTHIDIRNVLPSIHVPTLVVHRKGDRDVNVGNGVYLARHIEGARYVELAGDDHVLMGGDTDAIGDQIEEFLTGARPVAQSNRVLSTILFTDIVGSTEKAGEIGDSRWRSLLLAHNDLVRGELTRSRGHEIKTTGDGFVATFDGPGRAISCARAIVQNVESLGIAVRAGLHTGECELVGDDIAGVAVHIAARVAENAGGGEVLVSKTVKDLVSGSGIKFEDKGTYALKGVEGEWQLYAVSS
jgi:class 3 adenylate cyclase